MKLEWKLKMAMSKQDQYKMSIVIGWNGKPGSKHKYGKLKMVTFPRNKWGWGYWKRRMSKR
jgi:hypothetical protein